MSKIISGTLLVDVFSATGNPGEYSFENAIFNTVAGTGSGAYDITPGYVIFVPASDINTFTIIPGVSNRYVITSLTIIDGSTISGIMLWDGSDLETDAPTNGTLSIVSQTTPNLRLSAPAIDSFYPDLTLGSTLSATLNDIINIMDKIGGNSSTSFSEILNMSVNGETVFNLQFTPNNNENVTLTVNGLKYVYGMTNDFTITGSVLTWTDLSLVLEKEDTVLISYTY